MRILSCFGLYKLIHCLLDREGLVPDFLFLFFDV